MSLQCVFDDYDVSGFVRVAADFGQDRFGYVVTPNVDHLIRCHDDVHFRSLYQEAAYVLLDSRFLSHLFRVAKGLRMRVCAGSDLTEQLFARVIAPHDRVILIGGSEEQAAKMVKRYGLESFSHYNPPMGFAKDPQAVQVCVDYIEARSPFRFCFLAVGSPQQEMLAQRLKSRNTARGMALCVGASIDFLTGVERRAPVWMRNFGIEWLFRLLQNPRRMARRYLVRGPRVFSLLPATRVRVRRLIVPIERAPRTVPISVETGP
jgi:exopolysaccharide biosynthesis WecB/TagA/CpsF family protein